MGFTGNLMGFTGDLMGFTGNLMGFTGDLMGFTGNLMGFTGNLMGFTVFFFLQPDTLSAARETQQGNESTINQRKQEMI